MLSNSLIHCVASGNAIFLPIFNLRRRWASDGDRVARSAVFTRRLDSPRLSCGRRRVGAGRLLLPVSCGLTRVLGEAGGRAARSGLRSRLSTAGPNQTKQTDKRLLLLRASATYGMASAALGAFLA